MWRIIRDGIRRLWWMYLLVVLGSVFIVAAPLSSTVKIAAMGGIVIFAGIMLFVIEEDSSTKFRVFTLLPTTAMQRGRALVLLVAGVPAGICALVYLLGRVLHVFLPGIIQAPIPVTRFAGIVFFAMGVICIFMQIPGLGNRGVGRWKTWEAEGMTLFGWMVLYIFAAFFLYRMSLDQSSGPLHLFAGIVNGIEHLIGPKKHPHDIPEYIALTIAAAGIVRIFFKADTFSQFMSHLAAHGKWEGASLWFPAATRTHGFYESWVQEMQVGVRIAGILCLSFGLHAIFGRFLTNQSPRENFSTANWPVIVIMVAGLAGIPPAIPWLAGLRALRMLPFSRKGLTLYLLSFPLLAFFLCLIPVTITCAYYRGLWYALDVGWCMLIVFGLSMPVTSLLLLLRNALVGCVVLLLPIITMTLVFMLPDESMEAVHHSTLLYKMGVTLLLFAVGYLSMYASLAQSAAYRTKPWLGW